MGEKGLARRGWLVKMGQKLLPRSSTRDGRNVIRRVLMEEEESPPAGAIQRISREHDKLLKMLFDSSAVQKFDEHRKNELTFADACRFWGITENMKGEELDEKLEEMNKILAELDRVCADADAGGCRVVES